MNSQFVRNLIVEHNQKANLYDEMAGLKENEHDNDMFFYWVAMRQQEENIIGELEKVLSFLTR